MQKLFRHYAFEDVAKDSNFFRRQSNTLDNHRTEVFHLIERYWNGTWKYVRKMSRQSPKMCKFRWLGIEQDRRLWVLRGFVLHAL